MAVNGLLRSTAAASLTRCASPPESVVAGLGQYAQPRDQARLVVEECQRLLDGELQHLVDVQPAVADLEDPALVTRAFALVAHQLDPGGAVLAKK